MEHAEASGEGMDEMEFTELAEVMASDSKSVGPRAEKEAVRDGGKYEEESSDKRKNFSLLVKSREVEEKLGQELQKSHAKVDVENACNEKLRNTKFAEFHYVYKVKLTPPDSLMSVNLKNKLNTNK